MKQDYKILLVEDNHGDVLLVQEAVRAMNIACDLSVASDGEEALNILIHNTKEERISPDLILLDINMPRLDGKEVLKVIKADPTTKTIPVIAFTSSKSENDIREMYELYANSYIVKPIGLEELNNLVQIITKYWFEAVQRPGSTVKS